MQIQGYQSLPEFARRAPVDDSYFAELREAGVAAMDEAIDVFFKADREVAQARQTVNDLQELESALRACQDRAEESGAQNAQRARERLETVRTDGTLAPAAQEKPDPPKNGVLRREIGAEEASLQQPTVSDSTGGLRAFVRDLHQVLPLFTAAAMVPGPLSVTVKDMARELYSRRSQGASSFYSQQESTSLSGSLLLLGLSSSESRQVSSGSARSSETVDYQKVSTDERLVPQLFELRERVARLDQTPAQTAEIRARRTAHDVFQRTETTGFWFWKKTRTYETPGSPYQHSSRTVETVAWEPPRVWLPEAATQWATAQGPLVERSY